MTGWCPVHDRTYEADDGLCPRCGTALVTDDVPSDDATVIVRANEPETQSGPTPERPPSRRPITTVIGIAAAVVVAFVAGLAFPDAETAGDRTIASPRDAAVDLNVGVTRSSASFSLRLESFTQRGHNVVARISVGSADDVDLGKLRSASVWFVLAGGGEISDEVAVRSTITGFIIEGRLLPSATAPVIGVRIDSLGFGYAAGDDIPIDLSGVWPATRANQPRSDKATGKLELDGLGFDLRGIVGWVDHVDVGLSIIGARPGWDYGTRYELVSDAIYEGFAQGTPGSVIVRFDSLPSGKRRWSFRVSLGSASAVGPWEWSFV
jgi:hypothetical protein